MDKENKILIGGENYVTTYSTYSEMDMLNIITRHMGVLAKNITEEQFFMTKHLLRDGWELCDCFYGEKSKENKLISKLKSTPNWFRFVGINCDNNINVESRIIDKKEIELYVSDYTLYINYNNNTIYLYDNTLDEPELIGTFHCYDDIKRNLKHIKGCIPARLKLNMNLNRYADFGDDETYMPNAFGFPYYEIDTNKLKKISV